jgi:hypothetical protein
MRLARSYVIGVIGVIALTAYAADARPRQNNHHHHNPYAYLYNYAYPGDVQFRDGYRNNIPQRSYDVYDTRGHYVGSDPDPTVRSQLSHDPGQGRDWIRSTAVTAQVILCTKCTSSPRYPGYLVPTNGDIPQLDVLFVHEFDEEATALGAKGLGELTAVSVAPAIASAVYHATGKRVRDIPITVKKLLWSWARNEAAHSEKSTWGLALDPRQVKR